ncbi:MAG: U32 family peptidase [Candidatus Lernaella stagnicola]|nr:U32 family peptidase [Candidatus Lernaella stagnicola]
MAEETTTKLVLAVGTNFDNDLIERLRGLHVAELYGATSATPFGGGRPKMVLPHLSAERVQEHIRNARDAGFRFSYLFNAACYGNHEFIARHQHTLLDYAAELVDWGVTGFTVASPFLIDLLSRRFPDVAIKASVFCQIDSISRLQYYLAAGVTEVAFPFDANRNFEFLKAARAATDARFTLVGNELCLFKCMYTPFHGCAVAHDSQGFDRGGSPLAHNYWVLRCTGDRYRHPEEFLKARWLRPEDLDTYEEMGVNVVKLATRDKSTGWIVRCATAYHERHYDGNLLDILNSIEGYVEYQRQHDPRFSRKIALARRVPGPLFKAMAAVASRLPGFRGRNTFASFGRMPGDLAHLLLEYYEQTPQVEIDNRVLDGFLDRFREIDCLDTDCDTCGHCRHFADQSVRFDDSAVQRQLERIEQILARVRVDGER